MDVSHLYHEMTSQSSYTQTMEAWKVIPDVYKLNWIKLLLSQTQQAQYIVNINFWKLT